MYTHMLLTSIATSDVNSWHVGMDPEPDPRIRTTYFTDPDSDPAADSVKSRYTSVRLLLAPIMNFVLFCIHYVEILSLQEKNLIWPLSILSISGTELSSYSVYADLS